MTTTGPGARPELVDLVDCLDDLDPILDPASDKIPTAGGLPITADQMRLLDHSTIGEIIEAAKEASERAAWRAVAMGNAIEASKAARHVLAPYWTDDTKLRDAMAAAPSDIAEKAAALFAESDHWSRAIDDKRWSMTEADLEAGWLLGKFSRVELNEEGECVRWRQITVLDPTAAEQRADMVADYREAKANADALMERLVAEQPNGTTHEDRVNQVVASMSEEDRRRLTLPVAIAAVIDVFDEKYGVPVDHAGMPVGGAR